MNEDGDRGPDRGPDVGSIVGGIFLILLALCLIFVGGGCTIMLLTFLTGPDLAEMVPWLLASLAVLGAGATAMWFGVRLVMGKYR